MSPGRPRQSKSLSPIKFDPRRGMSSQVTLAIEAEDLAKSFGETKAVCG
jgi:hypothetical protein